MAPTPTAELALVKRDPVLEQSLERFPLCELPTPIVRAQTLERAAGTGPLFVKRDERSASPYGGNKPRKLEWVLGRARARGVRRVMTFGALGTNHGFASALYAARAGLACELVLVHQPVDASVRRKLLLDVAVGARLHYGATPVGAAATALLLLARHPRTAVIPTGGSSARGAIGFVNAGLELAAQVQAGMLPEPARLYLALGSRGSAAGLAVGLALAGLRTRVVSVLVTHRLPASKRGIERLARRSLGELARAGARVAVDSLPLALEVETGFRGPGYGHTTPEGAEAVRLARDCEGLELEGTYTGKALAALLGRERGRGEPVLFWNTYAGAAPDLELPDWRALPRSLQRFFRGVEGA